MSLIIGYRINCLNFFWDERGLCSSCQHGSTRQYCKYVSTETVLVCFLGKRSWPKATSPGKGSFEFIAYSPPSREITENTLQDPRGRNRSRGHGQMLLTGLLPVGFSDFFLIALWMTGGSSLSKSGPLKKTSHLSRKYFPPRLVYRHFSFVVSLR